MEKTITETLHSLGLKTTKESLNKTIFLLNFGSLKSHQAVFDEAFNEIAEAKQQRSWQVITNCLNENTNAEMTVMTVRTMFKRAKAKSAQVSNSVNVHHISRVDIPLPRSFAHYVRSFDCGERCGLVDGDLFDLLRLKCTKAP